ncbi:hypothetical protein F5B20DRAFT_586386 [Whalleya microplaca]|nr:hypothetical protein F5B20DRAFT_586386 [Whalleya microplaca]
MSSRQNHFEDGYYRTLYASSYRPAEGSPQGPYALDYNTVQYVTPGEYLHDRGMTSNASHPPENRPERSVHDGDSTIEAPGLNEDHVDVDMDAPPTRNEPSPQSDRRTQSDPPSEREPSVTSEAPTQSHPPTQGGLPPRDEPLRRSERTRRSERPVTIVIDSDDEMDEDPEEYFRCHLCNAEKNTEKALKEHIRTKHIGTQCFFPGCNVSTNTEDELTEHFMAVHNTVTISQGPDRRRFGCPWPGCTNIFVQASSATRHLLWHQSDRAEEEAEGDSEEESESGSEEESESDSEEEAESDS